MAPAQADTWLATGEISAIDFSKRMVTLTDGQIFRAGDRLKLSKRTIGEKVIIFYEAANGSLTATKIRRAPGALESYALPSERRPRLEAEAEIVE
jgi:Cu/Ag efflux protein CusF